ncbi:RecQ family ATP-dependent DNA helicase [Nitriliruptor alkaliphilus]|uniref:RecQ family ATP-dependent DNA helicase n=1 Tax=Nitriliruptor alkaliphilus TaxID=427918 RepID=UPI00069825AF|nr:DEAD/DEAH box helicase [Nitriliruptor alkaliphilus]
MSDAAPTASTAHLRTGEAAQAQLTRLAGPDAVLRDDQATAIEALVEDRRRVLVVQRTGWGKSAVYFIATRLLRDRGAGPTLLVSPLLALMRDQLAAARRMGLTAETVNSTNVDDWTAIEQRVVDGEVDLLLVSPERLNHPRFRREILDRLLARIGMLVVDEAHCISDHGHDFRPDYRRIRDVLALLDASRDEAVPVLACTATATDRVVEDVAVQLATGADGSPVGELPGTPPRVEVLRGPLARDTLHLEVVHRDRHEDRLAWLAAFVRQQAPLGRAGIVYTLTVAEAETTARWLADRGLAATSYTSALDTETRADVEDRLRANDLDVVVATTALSMGYDKPDLGFVVHLGAPSSPVAYYQAVGRAGRGGHDAPIVCLPTGLDERLWAHFDVAGVPTPEEVEAVLAALDEDTPRSVPALEPAVNLRRTRLELLLKVLDVDGYVERVDGGYLATGRAYVHDHVRYDRLLAGRRAEHAVMRSYLSADTSGCRMRQLVTALDDPTGTDCGRCDRCRGQQLDVPVDDELVELARQHLRGRDVVLIPRRRWPTGLKALGHDRRGNLARDVQAAEGRALADGDRSGWGDVVRPLLRASAAGQLVGVADGSAPLDPDLGDALDDVVAGLVTVLARWGWRTRPAAIVPIPSATHADLVTLLARRLGDVGKLPIVPALVRRPGTPPQRSMGNSAHQAANALDTVAIDPTVALPDGPVLLIDAVRSSGWTATVAATLLAEAGSGPVLPLALVTTHG